MPLSKLLRPTFRVKMLLALLGTVAPLLLVTLLVVRHEANRQVDLVVESTVTRAGEAFARIEQIRQQQLQQLGARFANSNRSVAALQQGLEGDAPFLIENTGYDLRLAGVPSALASFSTLSGEPIAAVLNGEALADPSVAVSTSAIDRLFAGDTSVFGYHQIDKQLFSIHPVVLYLGPEPLGVLLLGFAIDDETAFTLGQALGADVCFAVSGECVASSGRAANVKHFKEVTRPLPGAAGTGTQIMLKIPLDHVIRPFEKIQSSIRYIGLAALVLAVLLALILSRGFAQPVRALVAATTRVARGEYDTHVTVRTRDEIGLLADAFNEMTHGLLLKEKYRGVLDKVVSRDVADEMLKGEIKLGGETREVTTLFADVRGFTSMSEGMPPHEVVALLNEIMDCAESAVVEEGGVVDKYVGDEIMAIFGAPMSQGDDALRAVRAGIRIQSEVRAINERRSRDLPPLTVGVGINTGIVVAGNMGSARRLNYTVLGAPVNLAARLCSEAHGGQVLISDATLECVKDFVDVTPLGARTMKGISRPVEIFAVGALRENLVHATSSAATGMALIAMLLLAPLPALAQRTFTLGPLQIVPSARLDAIAFVTDSEPAGMLVDSTSFVTGRASGFLDVFAGRHIYGLFELRVDQGDIPRTGEIDVRLEQAFLRYTPFSEVDASLQAGRFVSPFGNYPQRHHSSSDPLIRPPLAYDYRTLVTWGIPPGSHDGFITWKDRPDIFRPIGAPPVWAAPYQLGAMLVGSIGPASYRLAVMNGAPSAEPDVWNLWPASIDLTSYVAHLGVQATPELRLGASFSDGPFLHPDADTILFEPGHDRSDFNQTLIGLEATVTRGFVEVRAEVIHDAWYVPRVREDVIDISWYVESKVKLKPGLHAAVRYNSIHFNDLVTSDGRSVAWDYTARRIQLGAAYRVTESIDVRGEVMLNSIAGPRDPDDNLLAFQASWFLQ